MKFSYLAMTAYDGPAPPFHVWPVAPAYCDRDIAARSVRKTIELCQLAERIGFDCVSVAEHHYAPYMMTPNPLVLAGAIAQATQRVTIALLGPLVPLTNPIRLAEEVAMLDSLSDGRVIVLFLRGTPNEALTQDLATEQTRGMTQEGIDLIMKAWLEPKPFNWEGRHYKFSTISVWPRPKQIPHPPVFGSGNSTESIAFAAERRLGIGFSFAPPEQVRYWIKLYRDLAARAGWSPSRAHVLYRGIAHVADSDARAESDMMTHFAAKATESASLQQETLGGPPTAALIDKPFFVAGPATLLERLRLLHDCGVGIVDLAFSIGNYAQQGHAMELLAKEVLPVAQSWSLD
jgi:alkanesulfonate monooxygenase SsuD/methylene tetrahydromethanopterin reductase-like flavin-dependent oxidoreductase (luciferase family)